MGIVRDSFVVLKNWVEAIEVLPSKNQLEAYKAMAKYGLTGEIPEGLSPITHALIISFSDRMDRNIAKYQASVENGKKGGRPPKIKDENTEIENLEKPKKTQENLEEPNPNLNVNVNVNDNVNVSKLVKKKLNIFCQYAHAGKDERVPERSDEERRPLVEKYDEFFKTTCVQKHKDVALEIIDTIIEAEEQAASEDGLKFDFKVFDKKSFSELIERIDFYKFRSIASQLIFNQVIENRPLYILGCLVNAGANGKL